MAFTVAIVGRPNVGKSTLFNRLVGRRAALVAPVPGVTRDRREGSGRIGPLRFRVIDTAGLEEGDPETLAGRMMRQTERALAEADVALFLVDGRAGLTPADGHFADLLRRAGKPVVLVVNKCEGEAGVDTLAEAYRFGLGDPIAISAEHGEGMGDLYDSLASFEAGPPGEGTAEGASRETSKPLRLAIVGRPNVGKSTLLNRLIGDERVVAGPEPGLTRDAIATQWTFEGKLIELVDTAGLRRRARVTEALEKLSSADARTALGNADVVVVVLDARDPPARQDLGIAASVVEEGRALVLALNKWDLVQDRDGVRRDMANRLVKTLPQVRGVPVVACSALTGEGVEELMPAVLGAHDIWNRRIATAALNRWLAEVTEHHPPPLAAGRRLRLRYMTQIKARPPTFAIFINRPTALPKSYRRYLVNGLREAFGLQGVPVRLMLRKGKNPYASA